MPRATPVLFTSRSNPSLLKAMQICIKSDTVPTFSSANMYYQFTFIFVQLTGIFLDYKWTHSVRKASQYYKKILAWENVCNWLYAEKLLFRCHPVVFHVMFCRIPPFILTRFLGVSSIAFPSCFMEGCCCRLLHVLHILLVSILDWGQIH
jgi:hypothetical protein